MKTQRTALVNWAKQLHKQLSERIRKGSAVKGEQAKSLLLDLKWRQSVLNSIITYTASWDSSQLAALALRLCVRMPAEFLDNAIFQLADTHDLVARDELLTRIGEVDLTGADQTVAKERLFPLIQDAAALAFDVHEWAYKSWFAAAA